MTPTPDTHEFTVPQDWTTGGVQTLSIPFRGQKGNTGTLYVKINDTKVPYPRDPGNIALGAWVAWNIDLASVDTNLQSITKLVMTFAQSFFRLRSFFDLLAEILISR